VLEPYLPDGIHPEGHRGYLTQSPELLKQDLIELDREGITVKIHATGDRSARVALDAVEAARKANGPSGLWHEVSHAEMIHPDDLPRFAALNVVAEMCPILWYPGPLHSMMEKALGKDRSERFWQSKTLLESGALVNYGSDWPSVVPSANPWPGIEAMVTRKNPHDEYPGSLGASEALDLKRVLQIFTLNGAKSVYMEDATGSLVPGKYADFIVLDRHLFDIPPEAISDTRVLRTVFRGNTVYEAR
jgi:predicted amidohydrolase YtcJ